MAQQNHGKDTNAATLLHKMMGEISEKQWETYKLMKSAQSDLVSDLFDSQSDFSSDGEEADNTALQTAKAVHSIDGEEIIVAHLETDFENSVVIDHEMSIEKTVETIAQTWDKNLTFKYIDGELSFEELANVMEKKAQEDELNVSESTVTVADKEDNNDELIESEPSDNDNDDPDWRPETEFEIELAKSQQTRRRKFPRVAGARRSKLPRDLLGLVGEANLCFVRGKHEDAIRMCLEVIRLEPTAPEPFQTLGMLYEEMGDLEKAYQYHLITAYLCPSDCANWIKVAEMAVEQANYQQAISCYSRAIKLKPSNIDLHWNRCRLYEKIDDKKRALEGYENIIKLLKPTDGEIGIQLAKDIAKIHFSNLNIAASISVMETAFQRYPNYIASEDVNLYVELLISKRKYFQSLVALYQYCGIKFEIDGIICDNLTEDLLESRKDVLIVRLPFDVIPIDIRAKLIVCLIHLHCFVSVPSLKQAIVNENAEEMGDLYLDIAEAFVAEDMDSEAEPLLAELIYTQNYNLAAVWLRYARCLKKLSKLEEAIAAYNEVIRQVPDHYEAKLELTDLLIALGRHEAATAATGQEGASSLSLDLLLIRCKLLYQQELWKDFVIAAKLLLRNDMYYLTHEKEFSVMIHSTSYKTRLETLRDVHKELGIHNSRDLIFIGNKVSSEELLDIFLKLCYVLLDKLHNSKELQRILLSAFTSTFFNDSDSHKLEESLDFYVLMGMFLSENLNYCYSLSKAVIGRNLHNNQVWNVFCAMMLRYYQDLRHNRFCLRLFIKNPDIIALAYFNGHNALMSGSYKHALAEYVNIHKLDPNDPLAIFCIVLGFVHLACQKFITNRHSIIIQMSAFLDRYLEVRGYCQESYYNAGRVYHQLGLFTEAVHFYKRALQICNEIEVNRPEEAK
ncbi:general transcription factor 3C polypeptide 3-like protein, partial [Dinothrombium tinctorium]